MSVALKTKAHVANDAPQMASSLRTSKLSPRVVPLITLRQPKKKPKRWVIPSALVLAFATGAAAFWYAANILEVLTLPVLEPALVAVQDPEQAPAYAETVIPPFADVVAPIPVMPTLPEALAQAAVVAAAKDPTSGIALPASSLQAPYSVAPNNEATDPTIALVADKIKDTASFTEAPAQEEAAPVTVHSARSPEADNLLAKAQTKLDADDNEGAIAIYNRVLAHDHANRVALAGKAAALKSVGEYESASTTYHRLLALNPKDETVRVNLVSALGSWGTPAASEELQRMVVKHPGFAPAQAALAQSLVNQDNALSALPHAWRALQIEPNNVLYKLNLAIAYDRLGHSTDAIGFYRETLQAFNNADTPPPALPVSLPEIMQRVNYLESLMNSAEKLASRQ